LILNLAILSGENADEPSFSRRERLRVIAHSLVKLPKLESLMATLGNLTDNTRRLASHDAEARNHHIGGHDGAVENTDVVFNDGELANDGVVADVDVASDGSSLNDGSFADEDVIAQAKG
jgi:hypothetical protein